MITLLWAYNAHQACVAFVPFVDIGRRGFLNNGVRVCSPLLSGRNFDFGGNRNGGDVNPVRGGDWENDDFLENLSNSNANEKDNEEEREVGR